MAYGITLVLIGAGDFGLNVLGARAIARNREQVISAALQFGVLKFLFAAGVVVLLQLTWIADISHELKMLLSAFSLFIFFNQTSISWIFRGLEQMHLVALSNAILGGGALAGTLVFVHSPSDLYAVPLILGGAALASFLVLASILIWRHGLSSIWPVNASWRLHLGAALPIGLAGILNRLNSYLGILLLGLMVSREELALFRVAHMAFASAGFLGVSLAQSFFPFLSRSEDSDVEERRRALRRALKWLLWFLLPASWLSIAAARGIVESLFGSAYLGAVDSFRLLMFVVLLSGPSLLLRELLPAFGYGRAYFAVTSLSIVLGAFGGLLLVPILGILGMGLAMGMSEGIVFIGMYLYVRRRIGSFFPLKEVRSVAAGSLAGAGVTAVLQGNIGLANPRLATLVGLFCGACAGLIAWWFANGGMLRKPDRKNEVVLPYSGDESDGE